VTAVHRRRRHGQRPTRLDGLKPEAAADAITCA